jgi:hypothetical protein
MARASREPINASRSAKVSLARTGVSQVHRITTARIIYPPLPASDEPDGPEEVEMDDLIDEYQVCAA